MENSHSSVLDLFLRKQLHASVGWSLLIWETMEEECNSHALPHFGFICSTVYSSLRATQCSSGTCS